MRLDFNYLLPTRENAQGRSNRTSSTSPTAAVTIPTLGSLVQKKIGYRSSAENKAWTYLLLALARRMTLPPDLLSSVSTGSTQIPNLACWAFETFIKDVCKSLLSLDVGVRLIEDLRDVEFSEFDKDGSFAGAKVDKEKPHLVLILDNPGTSQDARRVIEPVFKTLTTPKQKALYRYAYSLFPKMAARTVNVATPYECEGLAEYHFWGGEKNEDDWKEQYAFDDEEEAEEMVPEYTRKQLDATFGGHPFSSKSKTRPAVESFVNSKVPRLQRIAKAVLLVEERMRRDEGVRPTCEHFDDVIGWASFIRWNDTDDTYLIIDSFYNELMQSGVGTETFGARPYQITSVTQADGLLDQIVDILSDLLAFDELIRAMTDMEPY